LWGGWWGVGCGVGWGGGGGCGVAVGVDDVASCRKVATQRHITTDVVR